MDETLRDLCDEQLTAAVRNAAGAAMEAQAAAANAALAVQEAASSAMAVTNFIPDEEENKPVLTVEMISDLLGPLRPSYDYLGVDPGMISQSRFINLHQQVFYRHEPPLQDIIGMTTYQHLLSLLEQAFAPMMNSAHAHSVNKKPLLDAIITAIYAGIDRIVSGRIPNPVYSGLRTGIEDLVAANRQRFTHGIMAKKADRNVPFGDRAQAVVEVTDPSGKLMQLYFTPDPTITAFELYRCQQLLDEYVPRDQRLAFIFDYDLAKHFTEPKPA